MHDKVTLSDQKYALLTRNVEQRLRFGYHGPHTGSISDVERSEKER